MSPILRAAATPVRFLCVAAAYFLATLCGVLFVVQPEHLAVFWPGGGLLLGYLLVIGRKGWPAAAAAAFVGNAVGNLTAGHTLAVSGGFAAVNAVEPLLVAWLFGLFRRSPPQLNTTADVFRLFLASTIGCAVTALAGAAVVTVGLGSQSFWGVWKVWWLADGVGMVLFAPLVVVAWAERLTRDWWRAVVRAGPPVTLAAAVAWAIFVSDLSRHLPLLSLTFVVFPFLLWVSLAGGPRAVTAAVVLVAGIAVWGTTEGTGPMQAVGTTAADRVLMAQAFAAAVCLSTLVLSFTLRERRQTEAALRKSDERFKAIFHSQFQFIGLMSTDGKLLEANRTALAAAGVREEDVLGRPFWETGWWAHDAPQQERLKQAVRTAAGGEQDRFEASHPTADGGLMWVDFSLTPFRDESGRVALLIPEGREISDRRRVEERLQESEERFELAVRGSQDGIWDWHITTGAVYFSPQWKGMLGYAENEVEHSFVEWERLVHPDDRPPVKAALGAYLDGSAPAYAVEIRMRHKDGGDRWILTRGVAVRDAAGKPTRMAGSHTDITDRKAAEEALRLSEARFKSLAANAPVGIYETDAVGNCLFVNARWCWKAGLTPEEAAGHGWVAAIHPDDRERVAAEWYAAAEAGREFVSDYRFRTPDGRVTWLSGRAVCIWGEAGRVHGHIGTVMNVTARREAEAKLRASEERYRSVVDALAEGIVVQDAGGRIVAHNRRAEQVLGLSADQLVGRTSLDPRWRAVRENGTPLPGDEHPSMVALRTRRPVFNTLMGVDRPAGGRAWLTVNAIPFGTDGGSVVASFHDVTEARRLSEQILASLHEKEVMLREIHHRVKNNLAVIASLFHLQIGYVTDDATRRLLEEAQARVRSMALVHEHLYNAADLGAVRFSDYTNTLVGQLFRSYRLPAAPVALNTDIRPTTLNIGQAIPCGLILNELVSNALKHAFPDGRGGTLTVGLCERDGACELWVADDGAGIPPDRLEGRPKSLGLRLVRTLTRQLDGTVEFTPTHPGTRVRVTFAIAGPTGAAHD